MCLGPAKEILFLSQLEILSEKKNGQQFISIFCSPAWKRWCSKAPKNQEPWPSVNSRWTLWFRNHSSVFGQDRDNGQTETRSLQAVHAVRCGHRFLCYLDGWCRGRTRWWRCDSRAQRSPPASPAGGIYSGSHRTRSSLCTSRSTPARGSCCTNTCNLKRTTISKSLPGKSLRFQGF